MKTINVPVLNIYEFECDPDLLERAYQDFLSQPVDFPKDYVDFPGEEPGKTTIYGYLDQDDAIPWYHDELYNWLQTCIDEVSATSLQWPLDICDTWTTKTTYKQKVKPHEHVFSVYSGLLYFTDHTGSNTLFYYKDAVREKYKDISPWQEPQGRLEFTPTKGKLLIFPSHLVHETKTHTELKNTRHTLSFNTFFSGRLCSVPTRFLETRIVTPKERYEAWKKKQEQK